MIIRPTNAEDSLFSRLKSISVGEKTLKTRKGKPKTVVIPEGAKRIPPGAYQLIFEKQKKLADSDEVQWRQLNPLKLLSGKTSMMATLAEVSLNMAAEKTLGRSTDPNPPVVHLDTGSVFFSPAKYRKLERKAAKIAAQESQKTGVAAQQVEEDQLGAALRELAERPIQTRQGTSDMAGAVFEEAQEQGRSEPEIVAGLAHVLGQGITDEGKVTLAARASHFLADLLPLTHDAKIMQCVLREAAEKVLKNPKRGRLHIRLEAAPPSSEKVLNFEFQPVINKIVPPKKKQKPE